MSKTSVPMLVIGTIAISLGIALGVAIGISNPDYSVKQVDGVSDLPPCPNEKFMVSDAHGILYIIYSKSNEIYIASCQRVMGGWQCNPPDLLTKCG